MKRHPSIKNKQVYLEKLFEKQSKQKMVTKNDKYRGIYYDKGFKYKSRIDTEDIANDINIWFDSTDIDGKKIKEGFLRFVYIQFPLKGKPSPIVIRLNCDSYPSSYSIISICYLKDLSVFNSYGVCKSIDIVKDEIIEAIEFKEIDENYLFYLVSIYASEKNLGANIVNRISYYARTGDVKINLDTYISFLLELKIIKQDKIIEILSDYKSQDTQITVNKLYSLIEDKLEVDISILKELHQEKNITDYITDIIKIKNINQKTKKNLLHSLKTSYGKDNKTEVALKQSLKIPFDKLAPFPKVLDIYEKMDQEIYGMEGVKLRVSEFLAKKELNPDSNNRILCLVGEPGVGKTYFANKLSQITKLPFYPIAVGGMSDSSQLKGISRSYQGSEEGGVVKAMIYGEVSNPLILLDEIDKISSSYSGGKSAITGALLEILDPNQNKFFNDQFLDIEIDISKIWFIATANYLDRISPPLLDRLEIIEIPSYSFKDKMEIFKQFLFKDALKDSGIEKYNIIFEESEIKKFIKKYPEPGIRKLAEAVKTICANIALKIVTGKYNKISKININEEYIDSILKKHEKSKGIGFNN